MDYIELGITLGAFLLSIGLGLLSKKYKGKLTEIKELITYAIQAMDDEKIDKDEIKEIIRRIKELVN